MHWTQYRTDAEREADRERCRQGKPPNGLVRTGQVWADAPTELGPRRKWVRPTSSMKIALVVVYENQPELNYALADWQGAL